MPKLKPAKAKKKKRQIAEQITKRPVTPSPAPDVGVDAMKHVAVEVADVLMNGEWQTPEQLETALATAFGIDREDLLSRFVNDTGEFPDRFEEYDYHGDPAILDQHTGFVAVFGDGIARDSALASIEGSEEAVDSLSWTHITSGAEAYVTSDSENNRYFLLEHKTAGLAILDRFSQLVFPLLDEVMFDEANSLLGSMNLDADTGTRTMQDGGEPVEEWVQLGPLLAPPDDEEDSSVDDWHSLIQPAEIPGVGNEVQPGPGVLRVLVISSSAWQWGAVVDEQLEALSDHGKFNLVVITSGSPNGAEGRARAVAEARGWPVETIRDEGIGHAAIDYGVAFITNRSEGAERALAIAEQHRIPTRVLREQPAVRFDPWAGR